MLLRMPKKLQKVPTKNNSVALVETTMKIVRRHTPPSVLGLVYLLLFNAKSVYALLDCFIFVFCSDRNAVQLSVL